MLRTCQEVRHPATIEDRERPAMFRGLGPKSLDPLLVGFAVGDRQDMLRAKALLCEPSHVLADLGGPVLLQGNRHDDRLADCVMRWARHGVAASVARPLGRT